MSGWVWVEIEHERTSRFAGRHRQVRAAVDRCHCATEEERRRGRDLILASGKPGDSRPWTCTVHLIDRHDPDIQRCSNVARVLFSSTKLPNSWIYHHSEHMVPIASIHATYPRRLITPAWRVIESTSSHRRYRSFRPPVRRVLEERSLGVSQNAQ